MCHVAEVEKFQWGVVLTREWVVSIFPIKQRKHIYHPRGVLLAYMLPDKATPWLSSRHEEVH